jgi:hypothetical protein
MMRHTLASVASAHVVDRSIHPIGPVILHTRMSADRSEVPRNPQTRSLYAKGTIDRVEFTTFGIAQQAESRLT